jgi:SpoIID/LytB domain protein
VSYRVRRWKVWSTLPGDAEFAAGNQPIMLYTPTSVLPYRGALRSASTGSGRDTVNVVGLDAYVQGVIAREMPSYWHAEALKSQAVAARTYAVFERADAGSRYYDLCDTSHCQVYGGYTDEHTTTTAAVTATAGEILTYDGEPAFTQFSASNGGYSASGAFSYLVAEADPYDHGVPSDPMTTTFTAQQVTSHWTDLGDLVSVEVTEEGPAGEHGGRVLQVTVTGTDHTHVITGSTFASWFGLRSTIFEVTAS